MDRCLHREFIGIPNPARFPLIGRTNLLSLAQQDINDQGNKTNCIESNLRDTKSITYHEFLVASTTHQIKPNQSGNPLFAMHISSTILPLILTTVMQQAVTQYASNPYHIINTPDDPAHVVELVAIAPSAYVNKLLPSSKARVV